MKSLSLKILESSTEMHNSQSSNQRNKVEQYSATKGKATIVNRLPCSASCISKFAKPYDDQIAMNIIIVCRSLLPYPINVHILLLSIQMVGDRVNSCLSYWKRGFLKISACDSYNSKRTLQCPPKARVREKCCGKMPAHRWLCPTQLISSVKAKSNVILQSRSE